MMNVLVCLVQGDANIKQKVLVTDELIPGSPYVFTHAPLPSNFTITDFPLPEQRFVRGPHDGFTERRSIIMFIK